MYQIHARKPEVIDPIERCIYGEAHPRNDLSKEHVIPLGLGGGVILQKASCKGCRDTTSAFENICLRQNFGYVRAQREMPTRRPGERPTHGKLLVYDTGSEEEKTVPLGELPSVLTMPIYDSEPAYISGKTTSHSFAMGQHGNFSEVIGRAKLHTSGDIAVNFTFDIPAFLRLLAKLAHGFMWATYEAADIRPLLLPIILDGNVDDAWKLIGAGRKSNIELDPNLGAGGHLIQSQVCRTPTRGMFILITIQLFAEWNAPTYSVVTGECDRLPQQRKRHSRQHEGDVRNP
jgi:hypothetical protein